MNDFELQVVQLDKSGKIRRRLFGAPIKDTVTVPDGGFTIIRFFANNPGFWLFHCHIDYHIEVGMAFMFKVGDYSQMVQPPKDFPTCSNYKPDVTRQTSSGALRINDISRIIGVAVLIHLTHAVNQMTK